MSITTSLFKLLPPIKPHRIAVSCGWIFIENICVSIPWFLKQSAAFHLAADRSCARHTQRATMMQRTDDGAQDVTACATASEMTILGACRHMHTVMRSRRSLMASKAQRVAATTNQLSTVAKGESNSASAPLTRGEDSGLRWTSLSGWDGPRILLLQDVVATVCTCARPIEALALASR